MHKCWEERGINNNSPIPQATEVWWCIGGNSKWLPLNQPESSWACTQERSQDLELGGQICCWLYAMTLTAGSIATLEGFVFGVCDFDDATG